MSEQDMAPFAALIGTWDVVSTHPQFEGTVPGVHTYAWLEGGRFVVLRSTNEHELFPDAICVIGPPEEGDGLRSEYFDSRGVRRTYAVSIEDGVMRWSREEPGFDQRCVAPLGGDEFVLEWQVAEAPGEWKDDLRAVYRRRA